jgi:hypothetical protein
MVSKPGTFVAMGAPLPQPTGDSSVWASFRKTGGPAGGGYGLIVHDVGPEPRDGISQLGQFYVFEIGDRGEVAVWFHDSDHWVDLLPWAHSDAVRPGLTTNRLRVDVIDDRYTFFVNGDLIAEERSGPSRRGRRECSLVGTRTKLSSKALSWRPPEKSTTVRLASAVRPRGVDR